MNVALVLVLVFALWRAVVPFGDDCGPAVYEAIHDEGHVGYDPSQPLDGSGGGGSSKSSKSSGKSNVHQSPFGPDSEGFRYPCSSPARRRLAVSGMSAAVLALGLLAVRSQLPPAVSG